MFNAGAGIEYHNVAGASGTQCSKERVGFGRRQRIDVLDNLPLVEAGEATPSGTTWSSYDQPMIEVPGSWNTDARLCMLAQAPNPVTVGAVVVALTTIERL